MSRRAFLFVNSERMNQESTQPSPKNVSRFDGNDLMFYGGLVLLGLGLAFAISWPVALVVVGAVLAVVGFANAYVLLWLSRGG